MTTIKKTFSGALALLAVVLTSLACNGKGQNVTPIADRPEEATPSVALETEENASSAAVEPEEVAPVAETASDEGEAYETPALREGSGEQILRRMAYTVSYNKEMKLPNWVAWQLTAEHAEGTASRSGMKFQEDEEVDEPRATDADYRGSGYDRGHMCPAGDMKWSYDALLQTFIFTNCCPQIHGLNAGDWNEMEGQCRRWAKEYGQLYIACGPIIYKSQRRKTIGRNKVVVPEAFFKVVLRLKPTPAAIGFIYKNEAGDRPKSAYVNTVDQVERITGYDFFASLPDDIEAKVETEASLEDW